MHIWVLRIEIHIKIHGSVLLIGKAINGENHMIVKE